MSTTASALRELCRAGVILLGASTAMAQPSSPPPGSTEAPRITRRELLRRVDRSILVKKHHLDVTRLDLVELRMLLSIDGIEPATPQAGGELRVAYTLTNLTLQQARGTTTGQFQGKALVSIDGSSPAAIDLAPGQSLAGALRTSSPVREDTDILSLLYRDRVTCHQQPGPHGKPIEVCVPAVAAEASTAVTIEAPPEPDSDADGISDAREALLLARFRPFYRFSLDGGEDGYRPADAEWFVRRSELQDHHSETDTPVLEKAALLANPSLILTGTGSSHYLNLDNAFRNGEGDWNRIASEATGLYGRVSPLNLSAPDPTVITDRADINAYKVEYWQFFAYDSVPGQDCFASGVGSDAHEGDWEGVQVVVAKTPDLHLLRVRHNVHSTDVVFDLDKASGPPVSLGEGFVEYRGPSLPDEDFDLNINSSSDARHNNRLRLYCNEDGCTHPVAYIEHGGHAFWPTEQWTWPVVAKHGGDSPHKYLVATPVNLGEVGHPNAQCPACALVLGFDGHWGACGRQPPQGPPHQGSWSAP